MHPDDDFATYVGERWPTLVRSAVVLGCPLPEAEDAVQDALLRAFVHWDKVVRADNRDAYVYRILVNAVISSRRLRRNTEVPSSWVDDRPEPEGESDFETVDTVLRALRRLPARHRAVLVLRHYVGLTDNEIAEVLAIPLGTVKSRLNRAHTKLSEDSTLAHVMSNGELL